MASSSQSTTPTTTSSPLLAGDGRRIVPVTAETGAAANPKATRISPRPRRAGSQPAGPGVFRLRDARVSPNRAPLPDELMGQVAAIRQNQQRYAAYVAHCDKPRACGEARTEQALAALLSDLLDAPCPAQHTANVINAIETLGIVTARLTLPNPIDYGVLLADPTCPILAIPDQLTPLGVERLVLAGAWLFVSGSPSVVFERNVTIDQLIPDAPAPVEPDGPADPGSGQVCDEWCACTWVDPASGHIDPDRWLGLRFTRELAGFMAGADPVCDPACATDWMTPSLFDLPLYEDD